jgi:hypothetical protein
MTRLNEPVQAAMDPTGTDPAPNLLRGVCWQTRMMQRRFLALAAAGRYDQSFDTPEGDRPC